MDEQQRTAIAKVADALREVEAVKQKVAERMNEVYGEKQEETDKK